MTTVHLALEKQHIERAAIERFAPTAAMQLCDTLSGQVAYLPRGVAVKRAMRECSKTGGQDPALSFGCTTRQGRLGSYQAPT